MAGLKDIWICSLRPDMALMVITGEPSVLLSPSLDAYKGKLAIHASSYLDEEDEKDSFKRIIEMDWSPEDVPAGSLVGWCKVEKNIEYDTNTFADDLNKHCYSSHRLDIFKQQEEWLDAVHGLHLAEMQILKEPIMGAGKTRVHGEWWQSDNPFDLLCLTQCLKSDAVDLAAIL
jgi:hypothetical protein